MKHCQEPAHPTLLPFLVTPSALRGGHYPNLCPLSVQPSRTVFPCTLFAAALSPRLGLLGHLLVCTRVAWVTFHISRVEAAAARAQLSPHRADLWVVVCVPVGQQSTLAGGLCSRALGKPAGGLLGDGHAHTSSLLSRLCPNLERCLVFLTESFVPLCVGETQVHPQSCRQPRHAHTLTC